jgi:hypothetical protein
LAKIGRRGGVYYAVDSATGKRHSLHTKDKAEANELLVARNEAEREPAFNLHKARVYLAASDPQIASRTWSAALRALIAGKAKGSENRNRWETFAKDQALALILDKALLETRPEHLLEVVREGTITAERLRRGRLPKGGR